MTASDSTATPSLSDCILSGRGTGNPFSDWERWKKVSAPMPMPVSDKKGIVWDMDSSRKAFEEIQRQIDLNRVINPTKKITLTRRTLRFKGVVFVVTLEDEVVEFFEDEKNISTDEMRLIEVAYPEEYKRIKEAWMNAWKDLQASRAFDEY